MPNELFIFVEGGAVVVATFLLCVVGFSALICFLIGVEALRRIRSKF